jgi:gamma-glutamylcyclotransferase (GGCT)/AIG2-like uncharacterized protein YtfP
MSDVESVFVYGSLKQGFHNHDVMRQAGGTLVRPIISAERKYSLFSLGSFPALCYASAVETPFFIKGELYEVPQYGMKTLDYLESGYERVRIRLEDNNEAWVYLLRPYHGQRVMPMNAKKDVVEWGYKRRVDL